MQNIQIAQDVSVPISSILLKITLFSVLIAIASVIPFARLWDETRLWSALQNPIIIPLALFLILAHEGIHGIGWWLFGRVPIQHLTFGFQWKTLSPYCHAKAPMTVQGYRLGVILPALITGLLPLLVGTFSGDGLWAMLGAMLLAGAVGDFYVVWITRAIPADSKVLDHPKHAGCLILK